MVVRFLVSVSLLLTVALAPALLQGRSEAYGVVAVVSVAASPAEEPDESLHALRGNDARAALASAFAMMRHGRREELLAADPTYPRRLLLALAEGRLNSVRLLAGMVLVRLGDAAQAAALELCESDQGAERDIARQALELLQADSDLASWRSLSPLE